MIGPSPTNAACSFNLCTGCLSTPLGAHKATLQNVFKGSESLIAKESCHFCVNAAKLQWKHKLKKLLQFKTYFISNFAFVCVQEAPYVMLKKNAELFQDNDRYEGTLLIRSRPLSSAHSSRCPPINNTLV